MANSDIDRGAKAIASLNLDGQQQNRLRDAARKLGVSEQEAAILVNRAMRKLERGGRSNTPVDKVVDQLLMKAEGVDALNAEMPADIDLYRTINNREVDEGPQGNQNQLQNFGGRDGQGNIKDVEQQLKEMAGAEGKVDPNVIKKRRWDKNEGERGGFVTDEFYAADGVPIPASFQEAAKQKDFGLQVPNQFAPAQQVMREELGRLQAGIDQFGAEAFPGAAGVAGALEDQIYGARGAEQALARELVAQDRDGLASEEIRRRADVQLSREFGRDPGFGGTQRAMPIDAYEIREQQILGELGSIRQNAEVVEANNWRAQAAANVLGQKFVEGGPGARADQAIANIGQIAKIGHAKVGYDFAVSNNPVDRGTAIPDALPLNLPDQYNAPATDNRFAGPLQRQEQWLADNAPGYKEYGAFQNYPQVAIGEQFAAAQRAIEGINFGTKNSPMNLSLGENAIGNLDDLQAAVDYAVELGQQQGIKFFNFQDGNNVYVPNPGIGEVLQKGGMNQNQVNDLVRGLWAVEGARRNPVNQVAKNFHAVGMGQPARRVEFGGHHEAVGGGMVEIAKLRGEKIKGQEVRGKLQALTGRVGNDTPLNAAELADARMPLIGGVKGQDIPRAEFVRKPVMGPGPTRLMSTDEVYERFGPVNGQIANQVIQRWEQAKGTNPDGFGVRVERQRNMDPGTATGGAGMGGGNRPTAVAAPTPDPWDTQPATGPGITEEVQRRMPTSRLNELAELNSGPTQGPRTPGIRQKIMNSIKRSPRNFVQAPRWQRWGAVGGGTALGAAGVSGLIGGERDRREEEVV